jgi:hypothetical protein
VGEGKLKASRRDILQAQAKGGDVEAEYTLENQPPLPEHAAHIWRYYLELSPTRGNNGYGPLRLTRQEIRLFEQDELITLDPWERRALMRIDAAFINSTRPKAAEEEL